MDIKDKIATGGKKALAFVLKNKRFWLLPIFLVYILINFVFSEFGFINYFSLKLDHSDLKDRIVLEQHRRDSLQKRIKQLTNDSTEIERLAREYYGMLKPGESLFLYKDTLKQVSK